jgi:FeS assembly protein IscX
MPNLKLQEGKMRWVDIQEIAIRLEEMHPEADNVNLRFTDLRQWVCDLPEFVDTPAGCNEKILEAIQMAWIDERG